MKDKQEKITKEQLIFLEESIRKVMDSGNIELARIMAHNVSLAIDDTLNTTKVKKKIKK